MKRHAKEIGKSISVILCALMLLFSSAIFPLQAYAKDLNSAFLNEEYWREVKDVEMKKFDFGKEEPQGVFRLFVDEENNMLYVNISLGLLNEPIQDETLKIHFDIYNNQNDYHFALDSNGLCDAMGEEENLFDFILNFDNISGGVILAGIKIENGSFVNNFGIALHYNGRNYFLIKNRSIDATPTTIEKTTNPKSEKDSNSNKKQSNKTTKLPTTARSTTAPSTKYKPKYDNIPITTTKGALVFGEAVTENNYTKSNKLSYSNKTLLLGIFGGVSVAIGIAFAIAYIANVKRSHNDSHND